MPPAPMTSTDRSPRPPSSASARVSPAWTSEPLTRSMPVSVCTRFATRRACWSTPLSAGSDVAVPLRAGERAAHLPEDLRLADGHRVEAGRDGEDVRDAAVLVVDEQVRLELGPVERAHLRQGGGHVGQRTVEGEALGIHLGAVARGDHDGLADVLRAQHGGLERGARLGVEGDGLEEGERGAVVRQPEDDEAHDEAPSGTATFWPWKARICSSVDRSTLRTTTPSGTASTAGREVEDGAHPGRDEVVAGLLGTLGRRRDDADGQAVVGDEAREVLHRAAPAGRRRAPRRRGGRRRAGR